MSVLSCSMLSNFSIRSFTFSVVSSCAGESDVDGFLSAIAGGAIFSLIFFNLGKMKSLFVYDFPSTCNLLLIGVGCDGSAAEIQIEFICYLR